MKSILASQNPHKALEFAAALPLIQVLPPPNAIPVDENASTFSGNARLKALSYAAAFDLNALADDSGLCVDALNGDPGVHSARYATLPPDVDLDPDRTAANNRKLLRALQNVPQSQRSAHFVCALCLVIVDPGDIRNIVAKHIQHPHILYYSDDNELLHDDLSQTHRIEIAVEGRANGYILNELSGTGGFGYDPLFYSTEASCTFAELTAQQKLDVSHRGNAIQRINEILRLL